MLLSIVLGTSLLLDPHRFDATIGDVTVIRSPDFYAHDKRIFLSSFPSDWLVQNFQGVFKCVLVVVTDTLLLALPKKQVDLAFYFITRGLDTHHIFNREKKVPPCLPTPIPPTVHPLEILMRMNVRFATRFSGMDTVLKPRKWMRLIHLSAFEFLIVDTNFAESVFGSTANTHFPRKKCRYRVP
jgi:hypothetical protein